jgi:molecular chaperone DnaJ
MVVSDYYKVLGVGKDATPDQIKRAYRDLAKKYHPDKSDGDDTKFKKINEAYETLSDTEKKTAYDNPGFGRRPFRGGFTTGDPSDVEEMFRQHFGGGFTDPRRRRPSTPPPLRGADIQEQQNVTIFEMVTQADKEISLSYAEACPICDGTAASKKSTCPDCTGTGYVNQYKMMGNMRMSSSGPCPSCRGAGFKVEESCTECNGGVIRTNRVYKYTIPPNANNGIILRFREQGANGRNGGPKGDLYVRLNLILPSKSALTKEQLDLLKNI